ncbi:MAG: LEA14-like dessication related protein [Chitinophagales bacterium]|jgi:LEA14-like dessication related protein
MRINIFLPTLVLMLGSCRSNSSKSLELQQFSEIKVSEFKKKKVGINTTLRFYNAEEKTLNISYIECDIVVNGKDVGTFIKKKNHDVPAKSIFELPIQVDFKPENAFLNLDYGMVKIKSDVVSDVSIEGYLLSRQNGNEEKVLISARQTVLFSNNKDLYIDEAGKIQEK